MFKTLPLKHNCKQEGRFNAKRPFVVCHIKNKLDNQLVNL